LGSAAGTCRKRVIYRDWTLGRFTVDRLMTILNRLGAQVHFRFLEKISA